jgi:hypothetical protein
MRPITSRDERELLARVEAEHGRETADALAVAMLPSVRAELAEIVARMGELVSEFPRLKSVRRSPGTVDS